MSSPPSELQTGIRLRITHFALWAFCASVLFTVNQWSLPAGMRDQLTTAGETASLVSVLLHSLALTGALVIFKHLYQRQLTLDNLQPGHWIALLMSLTPVFSMIFFPLMVVLKSDIARDSLGQTFWIAKFVSSLCYFGCFIILCLLAMKRSHVVRYWKAFFSLLLLSVVFLLSLNLLGLPQIASGYVNYLRHLPTLLDVATVLLLMIAVGQDSLRGIRPDWIHWAGVGSLLVITVWNAAWRYLI